MVHDQYKVNLPYIDGKLEQIVIKITLQIWTCYDFSYMLFAMEVTGFMVLCLVQFRLLLSIFMLSFLYLTGIRDEK